MHRVRAGVRLRVARHVRAQRVARASSERGFEGCRKARDRADRDNVRARPQPADRSAKSAYDTRSNQLVQVSADIIELDRALARYGPETKEARSLLERSVAATLERFWPAEGAQPIAIDPKASPVEALYDKIEELSPQNDAQRALRSQAETTALDMGRTRLLLFEHLDRSISVPFLVVLVFWLCIIFASFGLFAPRNATVIAVLCVCALSVSGAIFLILELDRSFEGLLKVSGAPLAQLGR
jgi:hypothetical protein